MPGRMKIYENDNLKTVLLKSFYKMKKLTSKNEY